MYDSAHDDDSDAGGIAQGLLGGGAGGGPGSRGPPPPRVTTENMYEPMAASYDSPRATYAPLHLTTFGGTRQVPPGGGGSLVQPPTRGDEDEGDCGEDSGHSSLHDYDPSGGGRGVYSDVYSTHTGQDALTATQVMYNPQLGSTYEKPMVASSNQGDRHSYQVCGGGSPPPAYEVVNIGDENTYMQNKVMVNHTKRRTVELPRWLCAGGALSLAIAIVVAIVLATMLLLYADKQDECDGGMVWSECGSPCDTTCDNLYPVCVAMCEPRCECPPDTPVSHDGHCLAPQQCPNFQNSSSSSSPSDQDFLWVEGSPDQEEVDEPQPPYEATHDDDEIDASGPYNHDDDSDDDEFSGHEPVESSGDGRAQGDGDYDGRAGGEDEEASGGDDEDDDDDYYYDYEEEPYTSVEDVSEYYGRDDWR